MKKIFLSLALAATTLMASAQNDTVVVKVGKQSQITFAIHDSEDLATLKKYDMQAVVNDLVARLERRDTTPSASGKEFLRDTTGRPATTVPFSEWKDQRWDKDRPDGRGFRANRRTYHSFTIDVGMNNYLEKGVFPDYSNSLYSVKPWGSWYVALNSTFRTRVAGKFFIEWGGGVSWYNFKFNNYNTVISKDDLGVIFSKDPRPYDFDKSKLTVAYVNASVVPMIDFGATGRKESIFDGRRFDRHGGFRIGAGPYVGYRIDSYTKQVWYENGDKQKSHSHDSYYLNNIRYGVRLQLGFRGTDLFFNYDMNELFTANKGPQLNAFSFGITL